MRLLDEAAFTVPCAGCGRNTGKTIGWLKVHDEFTCTGCGQPMALQTEEFLRAMREAGQSDSEFRQQIGPP